MKLTIGMAHHEDFHGAYFTIQALRMYHGPYFEIVVIDNSPGTEHSKALVDLCSQSQNIKYVPFKESTGTTQTREKIFEVATGDYVMVMDCHVLLVPGAVKALIEFYQANPDTKDLYSGPLVMDSLNSAYSHFDLHWSGQMWGVWGIARKCSCGYGYSYCDYNKKFLSLETDQKDLGYSCPKCGTALSPNGKALDIGPGAKPFQIPAQGLGLFTCKKSEWLGFNKEFKEFGGEEGYIHTKYLQAGRKTMCLPFLKWLHRFGRPEGHKYPSNILQRIKNYLIGFAELGLSTKELEDHFIMETKTVTAQQMEELKSSIDAYQIREKNNIVKGKNAEDIYNEIKNADTEWFREWINKYETFLDVSHASDVLLSAFNAPNIKKIYFRQKDRKQMEAIATLLKNKEKDLDVGSPDKIVKADIVALSHYEDAYQLDEYLEAIDDAGIDTVIVSGLMRDKGSIKRFNKWMRRNKWGIVDINPNTLSAVVKKGVESNKRLFEIGNGAGTKLKAKLAKLGFEITSNCKCEARAMAMDAMGIEWCENNLTTIMAWLKEEAVRRKLGAIFVPVLVKILVKKAIKEAKYDNISNSGN